MTGLVVVVAAVVVATVFGLYRRATDGRARAVAAAPRLAPSDLGQELGTAATFVQFSSAVCAPCRATRTLLADLVADDPALRHVDVDAEQRLDLVERFGIVRTPTVLLLDGSGTVHRRITGAPRRPEVLDALAGLPAA